MELTDKQVTGPATTAESHSDDWFYTKKESPRRRILCALSALIGMLAGLVPTLLYGMLAHTSYPLLFFCIPLGCLLFIQLFQCRGMKASFAWTLVFTVLGWYLAEVLASSLSFAHVYGIPLYELPRMMSYMLISSFLWQTITSESLYSYVFLILGCWIAYEYTLGGHAPAAEEVVSVPAAPAEDGGEVPRDSAAAENTDGASAGEKEKAVEPATREEEVAAVEPAAREEEDEEEDEFETYEQFMERQKKQ